MITVNRILLSDAEVLKNITKDFVGGDLTTGDFSKGVEGEAEVFRKEVTTQVVVEAVEDTLEMFVGTSQGVVVAGVADDDI